MVLTGKCKKCFLNYVYGLGLQELLVYDVSYNAMVIEWLDSVGIYIQIIPQTSCVGTAFYYLTGQDTNGEYYLTRQLATEEAIKQSNDIYNESKD